MDIPLCMADMGVHVIQAMKHFWVLSLEMSMFKGPTFWEYAQPSGKACQAPYWRVCHGHQVRKERAGTSKKNARESTSSQCHIKDDDSLEPSRDKVFQSMNYLDKRSVAFLIGKGGHSNALSEGLKDSSQWKNFRPSIRIADSLSQPYAFLWSKPQKEQGDPEAHTQMQRAFSNTIQAISPCHSSGIPELFLSILSLQDHSQKSRVWPVIVSTATKA